jgi:hypothetical protein
VLIGDMFFDLVDGAFERAAPSRLLLGNAHCFSETPVFASTYLLALATIAFIAIGMAPKLAGAARRLRPRPLRTSDTLPHVSTWSGQRRSVCSGRTRVGTFPVLCRRVNLRVVPVDKTD